MSNLNKIYIEVQIRFYYETFEAIQKTVDEFIIGKISNKESSIRYNYIEKKQKEIIKKLKKLIKDF